jgi:hypothetical protein
MASSAPRRVRRRGEAGRDRYRFRAMSPTDQLAQRLREIADRLRAPEVGEEEAEALAREAADLVGKASSEIEADLRAARAEDAS